MTGAQFSTDDVVVAVEIPGVYDGTCCFLLKDGRFVNRMTIFGGRRASATEAWIVEHGDALRAEWGIKAPGGVS